MMVSGPKYIRFHSHPTTQAYNVKHAHSLQRPSHPTNFKVNMGPRISWENTGAVSLEERTRESIAVVLTWAPAPGLLTEE